MESNNLNWLVHLHQYIMRYAWYRHDIHPEGHISTPPLLWTSGAVSCLSHHIYWDELTIHPCIYPFLDACLTWKTSQMLFFPLQFCPGDPGEMETTFRHQREIWSFYCSFCLSLALLSVRITCFISAGRHQNGMLPRFNWLYSMQRSSSTYRPSNFWSFHHLTEILPAASREALLWQLESLFLFLTHWWAEVRFDRWTQHWELLYLVDQLYSPA